MIVALLATCAVPLAVALPTPVLGPECPSKVMAFYYGWYGGPPEWRHWGAATDDPRFLHDPEQYEPAPGYPEHKRRDIASTNYPVLGPYDSHDLDRIDKHLLWSRRAGIDVLISSWWGPGGYEDGALDLLLDRIDANESPVRVSAYLETWALFAGHPLGADFFGNPDNWLPEKRAEIRERAAQWIAYLVNTYGDRPGLLRVEKGGREVPVIFVYTAALFHPREWQAIFVRVEQLTGDRGAYYQGDVEGADFSGLGTVFDGLHVYTPAHLTAEGWLSFAARVRDPEAAVEFPLSPVTDRATVGGDYRAWAAEARALGRSWAATVIPGFDDRQVRNPSFVVSRDRGVERTYDFLWREALESRPDWVLITSFNEWHEGTEIEPSVEFGHEFLDRTRAWADWVRSCSPGAVTPPETPPPEFDRARVHSRD